VGARLADMVQVGKELDQLFVEHLPQEAEWLQRIDGFGTGRPDRLTRWVDGVIGEAEALFQHQMRPDLAALGIVIKPVVQLDEWQRTWLHEYFVQRVYPILTPLAVDPGRPFPFISSESLNLLVELRRPERARSQQRASLFARIKIPHITPRLVAVPTRPLRAAGPAVNNTQLYVCSADLVRFFVHHLFPGMPVRHVNFFRLVRGETPLPGTVLGVSAHHHRQEEKPVVRLEVERRIVPSVLDWLTDHLNLPRFAVARHDRLFDWSCLPYLVAMTGEATAAG
jgi:polyphosphate kinase